MNIEQIIQISDPAIDEKAIFEQIERNLRQRDLSQAPIFAAFEVQPLSQQAGSPFPKALYDHLEQLNQLYAQLALDLPQPEKSMSFFARLVAKVKQPLHQLAIYYVNRLGGQQVAVNDEIRRILHLLVEELQKPDPRVIALEAEVEHLRTRLARLEEEKDG